MYTTVALIACPDGTDQLLTWVPQSKRWGRGRDKPTFMVVATNDAIIPQVNAYLAFLDKLSATPAKPP